MWLAVVHKSAYPTWFGMLILGLFLVVLVLMFRRRRNQARASQRQRQEQAQLQAQLQGQNAELRSIVATFFNVSQSVTTVVGSGPASAVEAGSHASSLELAEVRRRALVALGALDAIGVGGDSNSTNIPVGSGDGAVGADPAGVRGGRSADREALTEA